MKYCLDCRRSNLSEFNRCLACSGKTVNVDFKNILLKWLLEGCAVISMFLIMAWCVLVPFTFIVGWFMNLLVTEVTFSMLLSSIVKFYCTPMSFLYNIPFYYVIIALIILFFISFIGLKINHKKIVKKLNFEKTMVV